MGEVYPEAFAELLALVPGLERGGNLSAAYNRLLMSPEASLRDHAARSWCAWEDRLAPMAGPPSADITGALLVQATNHFAV